MAFFSGLNSDGNYHRSFCVSSHTLHVRGGSVSRRGLNQVYRRHARSQAEPPMKKHTRQTPAALRERGSGGEALLSEKRPLPQNLPPTAFPGGSAREGPFSERPPPSQHPETSPEFLPWASAHVIIDSRMPIRDAPQG